MKQNHTAGLQPKELNLQTASRLASEGRQELNLESNSMKFNFPENKQKSILCINFLLRMGASCYQILTVGRASFCSRKAKAIG